MKFISADGILYMTFDCYQGQGVVAAVSCRTGGVSEPPFSSLNMGFHTGDDADAVRENRRRYFEALGLSASRLVSGNQVHGTYIYKVTEKDAGRGALTMETAIPACDGFMTDEKDIPITMNAALFLRSGEAGDRAVSWRLEGDRRQYRCAHGGEDGEKLRLEAEGYPVCDRSGDWTGVLRGGGGSGRGIL